MKNFTVPIALNYEELLTLRVLCTAVQQESEKFLADAASASLEDIVIRRRNRDTMNGLIEKINERERALLSRVLA